MYIRRFLRASRRYLFSSPHLDATSAAGKYNGKGSSTSGRLRNNNRSGMPPAIDPPARIKPVFAAAALAYGLTAVTATSAYAQSQPADSATPGRDVASTTNADKEPAESDAATGLSQRPFMLGNIGGLRALLGEHGVTFNAQETSEIYGNLSGGTSRGASYDGATQFGINVDTRKAFGLRGGTFFVDALQIHGHGITTARLNALQSASGMEAEATTRLWELWYQQSLGETFDIKIGQQSLDQEFIVSEYANLFANATFGWPAVPSADLPAGGPAYPLSSLGVRLRLKPSDSFTVLGGIFDGKPASGDGDPQKINADGARFDVRSGALMIGEIQYSINQPSAVSAGDAAPCGLPGTYKLGVWYDSERFADQHFDTNGVSLANSASNGTPAMHHGNLGIYAVADQMVWRPRAASGRSLGVFTRVMGAPSDRNPVAFSIDAGVVLKAPFKGRDNDAAGLAIGYANFSSSASALDRDISHLQTPTYPVRSAETVVEATYQYQLAPWWLLQGEVQYFFRPGGGIPNQDNATRLGNELVVGMRTVLTF